MTVLRNVKIQPIHLSLGYHLAFSANCSLFLYVLIHVKANVKANCGHLISRQSQLSHMKLI